MHKKPSNLPSISLITVTLNSDKTLGKTLESVAAQTYPWVEYIIVDGASTDNTLALLSPYEAHIDRVISEKDQGIYDAMNKGIKAATGEIIGFLNADDVFEDEGVLKSISEAFSSEKIQACYGNLVYVDQEDKVVRYWKSGASKPGAFAKGWSPPHPTFYVRRECYAQYGGFDLRYPIGNDIELMMRFIEKHQIQAVHLPKVLVRMLKGGVSNNSVMNIVRQNQTIVQAAREHGLKVSWWSYLISKIFSRLWQLLSRPRRAAQ